MLVTLSQNATSSHTIVIETIGNPPSFATLVKPILVQTLSSNNLYIYSEMYTEDIINTNPSSLTINSYSFSSYVYEQPTALSLSVTGVPDWPSLTYQLIIDVPSLIGMSSASCSSETANLGCSLFAPTNTITISMLNSSSLPLNIILSINSLVAPPFGTPSQTFTLTTFDENNNQIQFDN